MPPGGIHRSSRERRKFTPEYKAEVVALVHSSGKAVTRIAKELDLTPSAVSRWVEQAKQRSTPEGRATIDDAAELRRLRKENARLIMERDFLKKATVHSSRQRNTSANALCGQS
jgi:transposase